MYKSCLQDSNGIKETPQKGESKGNPGEREREREGERERHFQRERGVEGDWLG